MITIILPAWFAVFLCVLVSFHAIIFILGMIKGFVVWRIGKLKKNKGDR